MDDNTLYLASNIKYLRTTMGKTQQDLAKICNKSNTAISNWEKGIREPDAIDLAKISDFFKVSLDLLFLKDLRFFKNNDDELETLYKNNKDKLSNKDKEHIKFIIEQAKKDNN